MAADVLVVDPGELGELLATLFSQYGIAAACAKTGEQALEVALRERPGAVVVEYDLHDADGLDVAELLRDELGAKIVVTYAHAHLSGEDRDAFGARLERADASFARPFRSRSLIERVAELLGYGFEPPETSGELAIIHLDEEAEEPLLLADEAKAAAVADDDDEEDIVFDIDIRALDTRAPGGQEFVYESAPTERQRPEAQGSPVPELVELPRDGISVPVAALSSEKSKTGAHQLGELLKQARERQHDGTAPPSTTVGGLEPLSERKGQLTPRVLGEVLDAFHQSQTTGEIWLARGAAQRVILLVRGVIVGARTNITGEQLPALVLKRGLLDVDKVAALMAGGDDDIHFKRAALAARAFDEAAIRRLLGEQTRRVALGAFAWRDGSYRVTLQGHGKRERFPVVLSVADAILRGALLTEPLEALRGAAPDDVRFGPNPDAAYGLDQVTLSPVEARLVVAMDGTKTMADLAALYPEVIERTRRGLAAGLLRLGLLRYAGQGPAEARRISFF